MAQREASEREWPGGRKPFVPVSVAHKLHGEYSACHETVSPPPGPELSGVHPLTNRASGKRHAHSRHVF